jgi:hypothetical protein
MTIAGIVLHRRSLAGFDPSVTGEQHTLLIDQHRRGKSDRLHAVGDLADLFLGMRTGIAWMQFDVIKPDRAYPTCGGRRGWLATRIMAAISHAALLNWFDSHGFAPVECGAAP